MSKKYSQATKLEIEKVMDWLGREEPVELATHQYVDADAVFSAALLKVLRPTTPLRFVRADEEINDEKVLAVDLSNGSSAVKGIEIGSAFGVIVEALRTLDYPVYNLFKDWAKQLNLTDSGKNTRDSVVLAQMVRAWKNCWGKDRDMKIVSEGMLLIAGMIKDARNYEQQKQIASKVEIVDNIAVISDGTKVKASLLFKRGAHAVIRQSSCGHCVLISKNLQNKGINLTALRNVFPSWFFHESGFMMSYGSVKAPKDYKESGKTLEQIVAIVDTWIRSYEVNGLI